MKPSRICVAWQNRSSPWPSSGRMNPKPLWFQATQTPVLRGPPSPPNSPLLGAPPPSRARPGCASGGAGCASAGAARLGAGAAIGHLPFVSGSVAEVVQRGLAAADEGRGRGGVQSRRLSGLVALSKRFVFGAPKAS